MFRKDGRCYALTASHVVAKSTTVELRISTVGAFGFAQGRVIARWDDQFTDLALIHVESGDVENCGPLLVLPVTIASSLRPSATGEIRLADDSGGTSVKPATLVEVDDRLVVIRAAEGVKQTYSGSTFFIGTTPVGILLRVDNDPKANGPTTALRFDVATALALEKLAAGEPEPAPPAAGDACKPPDDVKGDLAADSNGGAVVAWTALPEEARFAAMNLVSTKSCSGWRVRDPAYPVSIVIDLAGSGPVRVNQIVLDGVGVSAQELPREIEILTRRGTTGGWTSAGTSAFAAGATRLVVPLPDLLANQVMVKIHSGGSQTRVGLRRISIR